MDKKRDAQPVTVTQLTRTNSGIAFFNANKGSKVMDALTIDFHYEEKRNTPIKDLQQFKDGQFNVTGQIKWTAPTKEVFVKGTTKEVRDGILADGTGSIPISCWEDLATLKEFVNYRMAPVAPHNYYGQYLATTKETLAEELPIEELSAHKHSLSIDLNTVEAENSTQINERNNDLTTIVNADILNIKTNVFPLCTNPKCKRKIFPTPGAIVTECKSCKPPRKMLLKKCECDLNVYVSVIHEDNLLTLTVFANVLADYFDKNVLSLYRDNVNHRILEKKVLLPDNVSFIINPKKIVTKILNNTTLENPANDNDPHSEKALNCSNTVTGTELQCSDLGTE